MRTTPFMTVLLLLPLVGATSTLLRHTVAQRAQASDRVAVIEVVERRTVADPNDPRRLKTHTQLRVVENVRGTGPSSVTLVQLGGTQGAQVVLVPGDADFTVGERALVFLHCTEPARCYLVALGEGKLPITGEAVVVHDLFTGEYARRPLRALITELRQLPAQQVLGPVAPAAKPAVTP